MIAEIERLTASLAGHYRIERELGGGGMATVYLAHDVRHGRKVALKVLLPDLAATIGADRFLREVRITAGLTHPHILPLLDSGEAAGLLYYVTPYADGGTLRDRLKNEPQLPIETALAIARQVADALAHAHSRGVLHRDIRPENILFESGHAVVADFGIARALSAAGGEKLTVTGLALGTPAYMSALARVIELQPTMYLAHGDLAGHYERAGRTDDFTHAVRQFLLHSGPSTDDTIVAEVAQAFAGRAKAHRIGRLLDRPGAPTPHVSAARWFALAGLRDSAFARLRAAVAVHSFELFNVAPFLTRTLGDDPRWPVLLESSGLRP